MKKIKTDISKYLCVCTLLFFSAVQAAEAQGPVLNRAEVKTDMNGYGPAGVDGSVIITDLKLAEIGDSLLLAFHVEVNRRAINNRQTWRIVPELEVIETGEFTEFPTLLITGRQKDRHFSRKERFGNEWLMANYPDYKATIPKRTDTVLIYSVKIPYECWMDYAHLRMHQYLASPKEKRQLFSTDAYGRVELEPREPYQVKPVVRFITPDKEIKRRSAGFYSLIDFPVNVSRILPDFRRNPEELARIDHELTLIKDNPYIEIEAVFMEGHASPEGSVTLNDRLSRERVEALKRYFIERHGIEADIIQTAHITEDWEGLRAIVDNWDETSDKNAILAIIDGPDSPNVKEQRLRALSGWRVVVAKAFPLLRRTEYRVDYRVNDFSVEQSRELIETHPDLFSHYELYLLAMSYENDRTKRLEILEMILRYYPDDDIALNNYAAELINSGEISTARRYLERISDPFLAANNLGLAHLLSGEYEDAEKYLILFPATESTHNIRELQRKKDDEVKMRRYRHR